jgi:hypothetical protein
VYHLVVEELLGRGGDEFVYHIAADYAAGVTLQLKSAQDAPHKFALPMGGAVAIDVQAQRKGYDGPISLTVTGADELVVANGVIAEKQNAGKVILAAPAANAGEILPLRMHAKLERAGRSIDVPLGTTSILRAKWSGLPYPPAWLEGLVPIAITAEKAESLFAITTNRSDVKLAPGGEVSFALELTREHKDFKDPLLVVPAPLPSGITSVVRREGNGQDEKYQLTLQAAADCPPAKHELRYHCLGELKGRGQLVTVVLPLEVHAPVAEEGTADEPK